MVELFERASTCGHQMPKEFLVTWHFSFSAHKTWNITSSTLKKSKCVWECVWESVCVWERERFEVRCESCLFLIIFALWSASLSLSLSLCVCVCLYVFLFLSLSLWLYVLLKICPFWFFHTPSLCLYAFFVYNFCLCFSGHICLSLSFLFICSFVCLFIYLSVLLSACPYSCLSIFIHTYVSVCQVVNILICLFVHWSVCLSLFLIFSLTLSLCQAWCPLCNKTSILAFSLKPNTTPHQLIVSYCWKCNLSETNSIPLFLQLHATILVSHYQGFQHTFTHFSTREDTKSLVLVYTGGWISKLSS